MSYLNLNFNKLLTTINIYRMLLFIFLLVVAIKTNFIVNLYSFFQVLIIVPLCIFILTNKKLWVKKIIKKNKYEQSLKDIVSSQNKKGINHYFNLVLFYLCNFAIIFIIITSILKGV
jgi:hypothetical protein